MTEGETWADKGLETVWRISGVMQNHLAEACVICGIHERNASGFQMEAFAACVQEAAFCAEKLTGELRRLVLEYSEGKRERRAHEQEIVKLHGILAEYADEILRVELPFLLPHRKHSYTDYLYQPLLWALESWCERWLMEGKEIPHFEQATVCFVHMYDKGLLPDRIRDHDNIEAKQVVDALGTFFLSSDSGLALDTYHTTILGEQNRTFLFLMEKTRFVRWIFAQELTDVVSKKEGNPDVQKPTG